MIAILLASVALEGAVGYPDWLFRRIGHPVTWMGALLDCLERRLNRPGHSPRIQRVMGALALGILVSLTGGLALGLSFVFSQTPSGLVGEVLAVASLLAGRSLYQHVWHVGNRLRSDDLERARQAVGQIVGRDVSRLDEPGICRAAVESLAENYSDGVVAPALAYSLFGLPGMAIYKAVNTADSMIGHRTSRYFDFGWASARSDDLLNWIPARLAALTLALNRPWQLQDTAVIVWKDAPLHVSPNAGWPEAAMAAVLGLKLGGPRLYERQIVEGVWLGRGRAAVRQEDLARSLKIYLRATALFLLLLIGIEFF